MKKQESFAPEIALEDRVFGRFIVDQVAKNADRPYLGFLDKRWTYAEFFRDSQKLANGLNALGIGAQQPVILLLHNSGEFMLAYWALTFLNAIVVPVNTSLKGDTLAYLLRDVGARAVIADSTLVDNLATLQKEQLELIDNLIVVGGKGKPTHSLPIKKVLEWDEVCDSGMGSTICATSRFDDIHLIPYTSGTTGPSKGVLVSYAQTFQTSLTCINTVGMTREDIIYAPLPLFHGMSRTMGALPALILGAQAHLAPRFSGTKFWKEVTDVKATVGVTIFTIPPTLKANPPSELDRAHNLRVMFNGHHDPVFEERFGVKLVEAFAMTETGIVISSPWPERREGSSGRINPDWEAQVVDEMDRPLPVGEVGELIVRPKKPSIMMKGYLNKPAETAASMKNLWFHTGDHLRADADGFYFFDGRKKERIRSRGENISAYEVEAIVMQQPDVVECAVVAYPAGDGEDDVRLVAVMKDTSTLDEAQLATRIDAMLPKFMLPRYIEFRESLPKTLSGKVEKFRIVDTELQTGHWDRRSAVVKTTA